ncbi:polysaccharide pyruvyl transferase family protein [Polaribacter atrinae]|uniref:polysaccharide pyruvyl transferase family protein n=1 Tax=Polaribacter atrinae TaxID=1333662 RepID=UPI002490E65E|nr:polysaccharide pyruvyl transferase family protein [Polaribacter atrinae]
MILNELQKALIDFNLLFKTNRLNNSNIINLYRNNTDNIGDLMCAPHLYFDKLSKFKAIDILAHTSKNPINIIKWINELNNNNIIVGGGGLLDRKTFKYSIELLSETKKRGGKIVIWGAGHNNPTIKASKLYYDQINNFDLVGVRDYGVPKTEWVPCVSCMNINFDKKYRINHDFGVIQHQNIPIKDIDKLNFPKLINDDDFEKIIEFIGSVETLITNSYHAMYWAILMKRKVIVIPNSSKMLSFKYDSVFCDNNLNEIKRSLKKGNIYDGVLEECRNQNIQFSEKVFDYLKI